MQNNPEMKQFPELQKSIENPAEVLSTGEQKVIDMIVQSTGKNTKIGKNFEKNTTDMEQTLKQLQQIG